MLHIITNNENTKQVHTGIKDPWVWKLCNNGTVPLLPCGNSSYSPKRGCDMWHVITVPFLPLRSHRAMILNVVVSCNLVGKVKNLTKLVLINHSQGEKTGTKAESQNTPKKWTKTQDKYMSIHPKLLKLLHAIQLDPFIVWSHLYFIQSF